MDAIIKEAVREELKKQKDNTKKEEVKGSECSKTSGPTKGTERTVNRLSGLLLQIRNRSGQSTSVAAGANRNKKPRIDKEHRLQIRWMHYDKEKDKYVPVRNKQYSSLFTTIDYKKYCKYVCHNC